MGRHRYQRRWTPEGCGPNPPSMNAILFHSVYFPRQNPKTLLPCLKISVAATINKIRIHFMIPQILGIETIEFEKSAQRVQSPWSQRATADSLITSIVPTCPEGPDTAGCPPEPLPCASLEKPRTTLVSTLSPPRASEGGLSCVTILASNLLWGCCKDRRYW